MTNKSTKLETLSDDSNLRYSQGAKNIHDNINKITDDSALDLLSRPGVSSCKRSVATDFLPLASICSVCRKVTTFRCRKCNSAFYCSRLCQRKAWGFHKLTCGKVNGNNNTIIADERGVYPSQQFRDNYTIDGTAASADSGDDETVTDLNMTNVSINSNASRSHYALQNPLGIINNIGGGNNSGSSRINNIASKRSFAETDAVHLANGKDISTTSTRSSSSTLIDNTSSDDNHNSSNGGYKFNFYDDRGSTTTYSNDDNNNNDTIRSIRHSKGFDTSLYGIHEGNERLNCDEDDDDDNSVTSTTAVMECLPCSPAPSVHHRVPQTQADVIENEGVLMLVGLLGVSEGDARSAMQWYANNVDEAASYLMSNNINNSDNSYNNNNGSSGSRGGRSYSSVISTPSHSSLYGQLQQRDQVASSSSSSSYSATNTSSSSGSIEYDPAYIQQSKQHQRGSLFMNPASSATADSVATVVAANDDEVGWMMGNGNISSESSVFSSGSSSNGHIITKPPPLLRQQESFNSGCGDSNSRNVTALPPLVPLFIDQMMMDDKADNDIDGNESYSNTSCNNTNVNTPSVTFDDASVMHTKAGGKSVGFITPPRSKPLSLQSQSLPTDRIYNDNITSSCSSSSYFSSSSSSYPHDGGLSVKPRAYPFSVDSNNNFTTNTAVRDSLALKNDLAMRMTEKRQGSALMLCEFLGIAFDTAMRALECCNGDSERAAEWILSGNT